MSRSISEKCREAIDSNIVRARSYKSMESKQKPTRGRLQIAESLQYSLTQGDNFEQKVIKMLSAQINEGRT
jgi:hypothetical protein